MGMSLMSLGRESPGGSHPEDSAVTQRDSRTGQSWDSLIFTGDKKCNELNPIKMFYIHKFIMIFWKKQEVGHFGR